MCFSHGHFDNVEWTCMHQCMSDKESLVYAFFNLVHVRSRCSSWKMTHLFSKRSINDPWLQGRECSFSFYHLFSQQNLHASTSNKTDFCQTFNWDFPQTLRTYSQMADHYGFCRQLFFLAKIFFSSQTYMNFIFHLKIFFFFFFFFFFLVS